MVQGKRKWGIGPIKEFIEQHGLREKFDALTPPKVATVAYRDASFKFYIPDAMTDKMQLAPLLGWYHERSLLEAFHSVVDSNGTICDLGANFGSHTVYFAALMKPRRVHSWTLLLQGRRRVLRLSALRQTGFLVCPRGTMIDVVMKEVAECLFFWTVLWGW